jgi:hypothetical protein
MIFLRLEAQSGLSFQRPGCDPGPDFVGSVVAKVTPEEGFPHALHFSPSLSFHYYIILVFI